MLTLHHPLTSLESVCVCGSADAEPSRHTEECSLHTFSANSLLIVREQFLIFFGWTKCPRFHSCHSVWPLLLSAMLSLHFFPVFFAFVHKNEKDCNGHIVSYEYVRSCEKRTVNKSPSVDLAIAPIATGRSRCSYVSPIRHAAEQCDNTIATTFGHSLWACNWCRNAFHTKHTNKQTKTY